MLNREQTDYISSLRINYPGVDDVVLRKTLQDAGWPAEEVEEAAAMYHKDSSATQEAPLPVPSPSSAVGEFQTSADPEEPVPQPIPGVEPVFYPEQTYTSTPGTKKILITLGILLCVTALSVLGYYVVTQTSLLSSFFASKELTDETLLPTLYEKVTQIQTASYSSTLSLSVVDREPGAQSLSDALKPDADLSARYDRDTDRIRYIQKVQSVLEDAEFSSGSYPVSLSDAGLIPNDPLGTPYTYMRNPDGTGYTFIVTFETEEAITFVLDSVSVKSETERTARRDGMKVGIRPIDTIYPYGFSGTPDEPSILGFEASALESFIPRNLMVAVNVGGTIDTASNTPANARFRLGGEATFGDSTFAIDLEGIKKGERYFGIVHKFPSFFGMLSAITNKWVTLGKDDLDAYGYGEYVSFIAPHEGNETKNEFDEFRASLKQLFELAGKHKVVSITEKPTSEKIDGITYTKYKLSLVKEALVPFYEESLRALSTSTDIDLANDETLAYLKSENFAKTFDILNSNIGFTVWVDKEGFPAQFEVNFRFVPSSDATKLSDAQIMLKYQITLKDINKPVVVEEPSEYITLDEFMADLTGKSVAELTLGRQGNNVELIRNALDSYYEWVGAYPTTLAELVRVRSEVTQSNTAPEPEMSPFMSYLSDEPFIKAVPSDVYTKAPYGYVQKGNDDYKLTYSITLPPYTKDSDRYEYYTHKRNTSNSFDYYSADSLLIPKYVNGVNTANREDLSIKAAIPLDTDKDLLSDALEVVIGTNPQSADTDNDGFNDREELTSGTNPIGPG